MDLWQPSLLPIAKSTRNIAEAAAVVFKEHGAVKVVECWGNDVPDGTTTSFPMAVKRKEDEPACREGAFRPDYVEHTHKRALMLARVTGVLKMIGFINLT
jgi:uncharacterized protein YbaA (DUF1428 family)